MATLTPQFFRLLEAEVKDVSFKAFSQIELLYPQLFQRRPSTKAYEDAMLVAGLGTYATKPEGTPVAFDDPVQGAQVRTVHQTYALGWRASEEMMEDDQHGIMNQMAADLGDTARDHMERLAWGVLNDAHTGTTYTGLESERLFLSTHAQIKAGGTWSNTLAPAVALSQSGLESMYNLADTMTSHEGRFINQEMSILLIHPNEQHNAYVLLNTERKPGSSDWDRNTVASTRNGLTVLKVPYLSSTTNWSLHAAPGKNGLTWNDRRALRFDQATDSDTFDKKHYGSYRASPMIREQRNNYGSNA
jgi:hypothetical protein